MLARFKSIRDFCQKRVVASSLPPLLHVELTNVCNLKCPMCIRTTSMTRKLGYMPVDVAGKIAEEAAAGGVEFVTLQQLGESTLHPHFDQIIRKFKSCGLKTLLSTNGNLLNDDRQTRLAESGLDFLIFGLDAATEETYKTIRVGGDFHETLANVESFLRKLKERRKKMYVVMQFIYMSLNKEETAQFRAKWEGFGAHVWFKPLSVWNGEEAAIANLKPDPARRLNHHTLCDWPWRQMLIHWNGNAVACCNDYDGAVIFGNAAKNSLAEIWNGDVMRKFREAHIKGRETIDFCKNCPYVSLGPAQQAVFVLTDYLTSLKMQTKFEQFFRRYI